VQKASTAHLMGEKIQTCNEKWSKPPIAGKKLNLGGAYQGDLAMADFNRKLVKKDYKMEEGR